MRKEDKDIELFVETINQINMKQTMLDNIKRNVETFQMEYRSKEYTKKRPSYFSKSALAMAASILIIMMVGIPVSAKVYSYVKERMAQMPKETIDQAIDNLDKSQTEMYLFNRNFSEKEEELLIELERQYREGKFPKGKLLQVNSPEEVDGDRACYVISQGSYYFPDREMTEEELLQYIDYQQIINYGLDNRNKEEYVDEIAQMEKVEQSNQDKIVKLGGVSETEAVEIATTWMDTLYPNKRSGMEINSYLYSSVGEDTIGNDPLTLKYKNLYAIYVGVMHDHYYFWVDADTGKLTSFMHSTGNEAELDSYQSREEEIRSAIEFHLPRAKKEFHNRFLVENYEKVFARFTVSKDGESRDGRINYHFVTKGGDDYILVYLTQTGEMVEYYDSIYPAYIEMEEETKQNYIEMAKKYGREYEESVTYTVELK